MCPSTTIKPPRPARRHCLVSALSVVSVVSFGGWPWHAEATARVAVDCTQTNLLSLVPQPQSALVGAAVLPQLAHPTPQALVQTLASRLSGFLGRDLQQACDTGQLQKAFQEAVQADFAGGQCVSVSGWVLARTEVELCALAALSAESV